MEVPVFKSRQIAVETFLEQIDQIRKVGELQSAGVEVRFLGTFQERPYLFDKLLGMLQVFADGVLAVERKGGHFDIEERVINLDSVLLEEQLRHLLETGMHGLEFLVRNLVDVLEDFVGELRLYGLDFRHLVEQFRELCAAWLKGVVHHVVVSDELCTCLVQYLLQRVAFGALERAERRFPCGLEIQFRDGPAANDANFLLLLDQVRNDVYGELCLVRTGERLYGVSGRLVIERVYGCLVRLRIGRIGEVMVRRVIDMVVSRFFKERRLRQESVVADGSVKECVVCDFCGCPAFVRQVLFEEQLVGVVERDAAAVARELPVSL